ncbi:hypothetical protein L3X38_003550 [Prunus dulcis]|uniref:Ubiquitin-like protease family profile domain-containing protein n=1 Tax=Prunus dulcis TaxID=3755 RepID=A0AAD5F281_PRUDU|nr:hypothetical protein L3X38_003550 [Prunus dulcis]
MLVWSINWKKPCPVKKSIDLCYGRRQQKINRENPDPKVAEKATCQMYDGFFMDRRQGIYKMTLVLDPTTSCDDLQKQVSEGTLTVSGSNDILTLALGTPEHGGRVRGVGAGVSRTQFFNFLRQQRVKFADILKESLMEAVREETIKIEARAKESVMEEVRVDREIVLKQISQLIPNFDHNLLNKTPITPIPLPQDQSPKNSMSDKASCSNVIPFLLEEDNPTNDADAVEKMQDETNIYTTTAKKFTVVYDFYPVHLSKLDMPPPLLALCQFVQTNLAPTNDTVKIHIRAEVFGTDHGTFLLWEDILPFASMTEIRSTVIAVYMRYLFDYLKLENMPKNADGDQFYLVPYNPRGHWVLIIVRLAKETVYYMDSLPNRSVDEDMKNIVNT